MPELPEVELTRENLLQWIAGCDSALFSVRDPKLLPTESTRSLKRQFEQGSWQGIRRRGKQLLWDFANDLSLGIHLRMTGKFVLRELSVESSSERASLLLPSGSKIVFEDQRRFAVWVWGPRAQVEKDLGWNELGPDALLELPHADILHKANRRSSRSIRDLLLDQTLLAGIGNIVANEALFAGNIHPLTTGKQMSVVQWEALLNGIRSTLERSLERDRGKEILYQGEKGAENPFLLYGKSNKPCTTCGASVLAGKKTGRSFFYCPACQPPP